MAYSFYFSLNLLIKKQSWNLSCFDFRRAKVKAEKKAAKESKKRSSKTETSDEPQPSTSKKPKHSTEVVNGLKNGKVWLTVRAWILNTMEYQTF